MVAISSCEAEYIALREATKDANVFHHRVAHPLQNASINLTPTSSTTHYATNSLPKLYKFDRARG